MVEWKLTGWFRRFGNCRDASATHFSWYTRGAIVALGVGSWMVMTLNIAYVRAYGLCPLKMFRDSPNSRYVYIYIYCIVCIITVPVSTKSDMHKISFDLLPLRLGTRWGASCSLCCKERRQERVLGCCRCVSANCDNRPFQAGQFRAWGPSPWTQQRARFPHI